MSKIPKFRAWDIKNEVMCWVNNINFRKQEVWIEADNGDHETRHTLTRKFDEIVFMQSTGLKDKHGVEIFEGDIYRYKYYTGSGVKYRNSIVEWETTEVAYEGVFHGYEFDNHKIEVIGDIYQNPELLEGE